MKKMRKRKLRRHILVFLAFILSLYIFALPTAASLCHVLLISNNPINSYYAFVICMIIVFIPLIIGNILTRKKPEKYLKSKLAIAVWVIIIINIVLYLLSVYNL